MRTIKVLISVFVVLLVTVSALSVLYTGTTSASGGRYDKLFAAPNMVWDMNLLGNVTIDKPFKDINSDGYTDILVMTDNHSVSGYNLFVVSGVDGSLFTSVVTLSDVVNYNESDPSRGNFNVLADDSGYVWVVAQNASDQSSLWVKRYSETLNLLSSRHILLATTYDELKMTSYLADVDEDGTMELVLGSSYRNSNAILYDLTANITVYDSPDNPLWSYTTGVQNLPSTTLADTDYYYTTVSRSYGFNGTGTDVIFIDHVSPQNISRTEVKAFNGTDGSITWNKTFDGYVILQRDYTDSDMMVDDIVQSDYDADGKCELLLSGSLSSDFVNYLVDNNGSEIFNWTSDMPVVPGRTYSKGIAVVDDARIKYNYFYDVNGDGLSDLILINSTDVAAMDPFSGSLLWNTTLPATYDYGMPFLSMNELTGDTVNETYLAMLNDSGHGVRLYLCALNGASGSVIWNITMHNITGGNNNAFAYAPSVTDYNGDGSQDIVLLGNITNTSTDVYIPVFVVSGADGSTLSNRTIIFSPGENYTDADSWETSSVNSAADMDGDSIGDMVISLEYDNSTTGNHSSLVYILSGSDLSTLWNAYVTEDYNHNTVAVPLSTLSMYMGYSTDYNNNGKNDELLFSSDNYLGLYTLSGVEIPEITPMVIMAALPVALVVLRKRQA